MANYTTKPLEMRNSDKDLCEECFCKNSEIQQIFELFSYKANFIYSSFIPLSLMSAKMTWSNISSFKGQFPLFDLFFWSFFVSNNLTSIIFLDFIKFIQMFRHV